MVGLIKFRMPKTKANSVRLPCSFDSDSGILLSMPESNETRLIFPIWNSFDSRVELTIDGAEKIAFQVGNHMMPETTAVKLVDLFSDLKLYVSNVNLSLESADVTIGSLDHLFLYEIDPLTFEEIG